MEQGVVMEGGNSGSLEECLSLDPEIFATVLCFTPSLGVVFTEVLVPGAFSLSKWPLYI